jgi:hypothetical protein
VQDFTVVRRGIIEYADDHDGKFPKAETWQDDVRPYVSKLLASPSSNRPFKGITADGQWGCAPAGGAKTWTGMAFNQDLSEKKLADQKTPNETTLIFEIDAPSPNAHQVYKDRGATGPMIFGSHRPWLYLPIKGKSSMSTSTSKTTFGDDSDPFSTAPSKDDSETVKPAKKASDAKGKKKTGDSDDSDSSDRDQGSP